MSKSYTNFAMFLEERVNQSGKVCMIQDQISYHALMSLSQLRGYYTIDNQNSPDCTLIQGHIHPKHREACEPQTFKVETHRQNEPEETWGMIKTMKEMITRKR
jgi:hypothetical protein